MQNVATERSCSILTRVGKPHWPLCSFRSRCLWARWGGQSDGGFTRLSKTCRISWVRREETITQEQWLNVCDTDDLTPHACIDTPIAFQVCFSGNAALLSWLSRRFESTFFHVGPWCWVRGRCYVTPAITKWIILNLMFVRFRFPLPTPCKLLSVQVKFLFRCFFPRLIVTCGCTTSCPESFNVHLNKKLSLEWVFSFIFFLWRKQKETKKTHITESRQDRIKGSHESHFTHDCLHKWECGGIHGASFHTWTCSPHSARIKINTWINKSRLRGGK